MTMYHRYCSKCGREMIEYSDIAQFDTATGAAYKRKQCQTRKRGHDGVPQDITLQFVISVVLLGALLYVVSSYVLTGSL